MALVVKKLDDRQFEDLVVEAVKRIPYYCKEWTDHNLSDPGETLIELFAWMTDILLYRLNQVPDLHYIKFMQMLGIHLTEPQPAQVPVTFWFSEPQPNPIVIPQGTQVATTQTETEPSIVFTTEEVLKVQPPLWAAVISRTTSNLAKVDRDLEVAKLKAGLHEETIFSPVPLVDDALFFGFENNLSHHILGFEMDFNSAGGAGIVPEKPPTIWEASTGRQEGDWKACEKELDTTLGMNNAGKILIHLPKIEKAVLQNKELYWVRVRIVPHSQEEGGMYKKSPLLRKVIITSYGGTAPAMHAQQVKHEFLGQSDGSPGQRFQLQMVPVLKRRQDEKLTVQVEREELQYWNEVQDFASSGSEDRHYILDSASGEVRLGPAIRQPDGTIRLYGAIPPRGANLVFTMYRWGGGVAGNVQPGRLNTLKTAIPYIARVNNRFQAQGGVDQENVEAAKQRAPAMLRSRDRAVTESDFEFLSKQALPGRLGRVRCQQPRPEFGGATSGEVNILAIPMISGLGGFIQPGQLILSEEDKRDLFSYLDERRLLTTRLNILSPYWYWAAVKVSLEVSSTAEQPRVESVVLSRLYRSLNPLCGGPDGNGWPFGRSLFVSDIYPCLQNIPGVLFIHKVSVYKVKPGEGIPTGAEPVECIHPIVSHGVIVSGKHKVEFIAEKRR